MDNILKKIIEEIEIYKNTKGVYCEYSYIKNFLEEILNEINLLNNAAKQYEKCGKCGGKEMLLLRARCCNCDWE